MATFYESDSNPIASELVRQGFTLDRGEALRIINIDEKASETDTAIAIGTAAISLVAACGTLALSGFTLPILAPIAALGYAGLTAWNSRATKQEREFEADFLHNHPEFIEAVNQKLKAGEESDRVAAAYEHTLKAFIEGDAKRMQSFMPIATSPIGTATRLGAIAVNQPTSDEVKEVGEILCDRLAGQKTVLQQIAQRVAAQDIQGGLKMAIESAGFTPASFVEQFPGKGHVYDWAAGAISAVIPSSAIALPTIEPIAPELTVKQFIETTPTKGRLTDESETIAIAILDGLVSSQRSTLLIGGTGSGKSVTQAYLLVNLLKRCPDGEVRVISQKADRFAGLADIGRVTLFDQFNPGETLSVIDRVWSEYDRRRKLPEQSRVGLPPLRLLLCDWLSINAALEACAKDPEIKESRYLSKLIDVIYNGRELNVCLWIDLQSFNLAAIGMKADANSRRNFNLVGLGNYYVDEFGGVNESYGVLANMIQNKYFVDNDIQREKLMREFNRLKPISQANSRPIVFTTLEPARVALMADLRQYKTMQVISAQPATQSEPTDDPWQGEEAEISESYTFPSDPGECVKLAAKLVQESGIASASEIEQLVPGLSKYLPTVVLFYSECTRNKEVYKWAD